uniref:THAP domain-containing protein 1 n=1 Tax=Cyprinodon variegatus TaxID=28743 RepID=A0A3Q2D818_CYPVA
FNFSCCKYFERSEFDYSKLISFHRFPVDSVVRPHWLTKIRRQDFSPRRETRVCIRHFLLDDLLQTPRGKRCLKKGAFPVLFEWNNYSLPVPRPSVWERRPREEETKSPAAAAPTVDCLEMVFVAPEHDYCVSPASGVMIHELVMQNKALQKQVQMLQFEVQWLQLRTRFCLERFKCSDDDIRHYTRLVFVIIIVVVRLYVKYCLLVPYQRQNPLKAIQHKLPF